MSAIGTATSYASDISNLLLSNSSDASAPADPSTSAAAAASPPSSGSNDRGPATNVQLSDKVKSILAQADSDAVVAQRLQTFVQSKRTNDASNGSSTTQSSTIDVDQSFAELSGNTQATSDPTAQAPVQIVKSFATGLKTDGYTIAALASDQTGSSRIVILGPNGFSFTDQHFGWSDEAVTGSAPNNGAATSEYQAGNVEYITLTQEVAASTSVNASSNAGSASASSVAAESSTTTIAVDFSTGQVSLTQASAATTTAQITQPSRSFSTVA